MKNLLFIAVLLLITPFSSLLAQDNSVTSPEVTRAEKVAAFDKMLQEIELIEANTELSDQEKRAQIAQKRDAMRQKVGIPRGGHKLKGEALKSLDMDGRHKMQAEIEAEMDKIDQDNSLSAEQKRAAKKELIKNQKKKWQAKRQGRLASQQPSILDKLERTDLSTMSDDEKEDAIDELDRLKKKISKRAEKTQSTEARIAKLLEELKG